MSLFEFFRKYFGDINGRHTRPPETDSDDNYDFNKPRDSFRGPPDEENYMRDFPSNFGQTFSEINKRMEIKLKLIKFETKDLEIELSRNHHFDSFEPSKYVPVSEVNQDPRDTGSRNQDPRDTGSRNNPEKGLQGTHEDYSERPSISSCLDSFEPRSCVFSSFHKMTWAYIIYPDGTLITEETVTRSNGNEQSMVINTLLDDISNNLFVSGFFVSDIIGYPKLPNIKKIDPRAHFLKSEHENFNPNDDKDLDKQILQSGIESLPFPPKQPQIIEPPRLNDFKCSESFSFKIYSRRINRNISMRITECNGVVESERIIRFGDGTEKRTISQTFSDGFPLSRIVATGIIVLRGINDIIDALLDKA